MTDEKRITIEEARADPERYTVGVNNSIYDKQAGRIVAKYPSPAHDITAENAHAMRQRSKDIAMLSHLRGLAAARMVELPDDATLEDIVHNAGSAVEALVTHMAKTFMESKNLRGMGETFGRLVSPMTGEAERGAPGVVIINNSMSPEQATALERVWRDVMRLQNGEVIDGEATDVPKGDET